MDKSKENLLKMAAFGASLGIIIIGGFIIFRVFIAPAIKNSAPDAPLTVENSKDADFVRTGDVLIRMVNTVFMLNPKISADILEFNARIFPKQAGRTINLDDVNTFSIDINQGKIGLRAAVLETIFNESVFNYDGAPVKDLKINFITVDEKGKKEPRIELKGKIKYLVWINFTQLGRFEIDRASNLIVMKMESVKILGNLQALGIMKLLSMDLESILKLPEGRGVTIKKNNIILFPFKLFPPPRMSGILSDIGIDPANNRFIVSFDRPEKLYFPADGVQATNYVRVKKGNVKFGKLDMSDTDLILVDADPQDPFLFNLPKYEQHINHGKAIIRPNQSIVVIVPDFDDIK